MNFRANTQQFFGVEGTSCDKHIHKAGHNFNEHPKVTP